MVFATKENLFSKLKNNKGSVLLATYLLTTSLLILGAAFLMIGAAENRRSATQQKVTQAFYIAEAGIEQVLYELRQEFVERDKLWSNGVTIGGNPYGPDTVNFYDVYTDQIYPGTNYTHAYSLNPTNNHYSVKLLNVSGEEDIWVRSTGEVDGITQTIQMYIKMVNVSLWNNAIFAGAGASGQMINGNVDIRGSVYILGTGLADGDTAISMGGTAELVGNNYEGMPADLEGKIPALPTTILTGETNPSETLNAELRVKKGTVSLSGAATVGEQTRDPQDIDDGIKESVDGSYVTDGFEGTAGASNVYSDNLTAQAYDLGDEVVFPSLSNVSPSDPAMTRQEYFEDQTTAHNNPNSVNLETELSNLTSTSDFAYYHDANGDGTFDIVNEDLNGNSVLDAGEDFDGDGILDTVEEGISMDGNGNMVVLGQIYVSGPLTIGGSNPINYRGIGTILAENDVTITTNLVTSGINSYPSTNGTLDAGEDTVIVNGTLDAGEDLGGVLGIMTPGEMILGSSSQLDIMGLFYAEDKVTTNKQTNIVGTLVTNYFDTGGQVPAIYQVLTTVDNLPPGMIGTDENVWYTNVVSWQKCNNHTDSVCTDN